MERDYVFHLDAQGAAFNVKVHRAGKDWPSVEGETEELREAAYEEAQRQWWNDADAAARAAGFTGGVFACGRSSGYVVPCDGSGHARNAVTVGPDGTLSSADKKRLAKFGKWVAKETQPDKLRARFVAHLSAMINDAKEEALPGVAPDPSRPLTASAPFRVLGGRGIVDSVGRVILHCDARRVLDARGYTCDAYEGDDPRVLSPVAADANVHAIAHILNMHAAPSPAVALDARDAETVEAFCANLRAALRSNLRRHVCKVGGGEFNAHEMRVILRALGGDA